MSSSKPYKFSYGEQINQFTSYIYSAKLETDTVSTLIVPNISNCSIVAVINTRSEISPDSYISVTLDGTDPSVIASATSTFNPDFGFLINTNNHSSLFMVKSGDEIKFITNLVNEPYISVCFYTAESF